MHSDALASLLSIFFSLHARKRTPVLRHSGRHILPHGSRALDECLHRVGKKSPGDVLVAVDGLAIDDLVTSEIYRYCEKNMEVLEPFRRKTRLDLLDPMSRGNQQSLCPVTPHCAPWAPRQGIFDKAMCGNKRESDPWALLQVTCRTSRTGQSSTALSGRGCLSISWARRGPWSTSPFEEVGAGT